MPTHTYRVPLRDGITLAADLFLPEEGTGPWPVLIARSPYRRQGLAFLGEFSRHGYAVLIQDVRGTGESGGEFGFVGQEPPDALDTADWILAQPWCDGRLGIFGLSYLAAASLAIAAERPDHVRACVWVTLPAHPRWQAWQNGALRLHHILPWALQAARQDLSAYDWPASYWTPPAVPLVQALQEPAHPYWQQSDLTRYLSRVKAPGLHLAGWYDFMLDAALEPYEIMAASSGAPQRLVVGPWTHNGVLNRTSGAGDMDYGPAAVSDFLGESLAWFGHWFREKPMSGPPMRMFLTGAEPRWAECRHWPEQNRRLHLAPDGRLTDLPESGEPDWFVHDPGRPVPTQGGAVAEFRLAGIVAGPFPQTTAAHPDVLTYATEPLPEPLTVCGPITLELLAEAGGTAADFAAKLTDVAPDGTARYVCDGILRARFEAGQATRLEIRMSCGHTFGRGHRLRLELAGSNFPKFDLGPGPVRQAVHPGQSRLSLPVLERGSQKQQVEILPEGQ